MQQKAYTDVLIAAACWGCIGVFFKGLTAAGFTSMQVVAIRTTTAALCFALLLLCTNRSQLKVRPKDLHLFFGTGVCSLLLFNFCYFNAIALSSMAVAAVLLYTAPIFVMVMSAIFFHERITPVKVVALALTFGGCILVTGIGSGSSSISTAAILFGLGSGFFYGLYSIIAKVALERYSSSTVSLYTFLFAALGSLPLSGIWRAVPLFADWRVWLNGLGIGVLCCLIPYVFYTKGLAHIEGSKASIMATLEPAVATILGMVLFHEQMALGKALGMLLIFSAIVLLNIQLPTSTKVKKRGVS